MIMWITCDRCHNIFKQGEVLSNFCPQCAGMVFLGEAGVSETERLLKLSILYHRLLRDLEDICGVEFRERPRAFQAVSDFADEVKMLTLAEVVLAEVKPNKENLHENT